MRIATFEAGGAPRVGLVEGERVLDLAAARKRLDGVEGPATVLELIASPDGLASARSVLGRAGPAPDDWHKLDAVGLLAPIPRPAKNVFCVGRNYKLHIEEAARMRGAEPSYPKVPEFFTKPPTTVVGPGVDIRLPNVTKKLDYEVELAFVIGKTGRDIRAEDAAKHIFGFTIVNDVTARELQIEHGQWFKGKGLDTSCPMGPWIVTADAFDISKGHRISLTVNGETRQDERTSDMLFDCAQIVESLSAGLTLEAGDIIATGTPSGVGFIPPVWLKDGDVIEASIEGIGSLRNTVRAV